MSLFDKLKAHKSAPVAVLLGSGRSINDITKNQWAKIEKCDTWTMNNWIYHPTFVPDFYHLELKAYNFHIFRRHMDHKRKAYKDVKFIVPRRPIKVRLGSESKRRRHSISKAIGKHSYIYLYNYRSRKLKPKNKSEQRAVNARYRMKSLVRKSYDASLSVVLELICRLDYKELYIFGVDMNNSYYFWSDGNPKYGEVHHKTNKAHEKKNPKKAHSASHMKKFVIDFNKRHMEPNGKYIYIGSLNGALNKRMEYRDISKLKIDW